MICTRCKRQFEPRNGDYVTMCDTCDYEIADAMITANSILEGVLGRKDLTFAQFRQAMIEGHSRFLSDQDLHDLWVDLAEQPTKTEAVKAVDQAMVWVSKQQTSRYSKPEGVFGPMAPPAPTGVRERLHNLLSRVRTRHA